jgi:hypothetical protein
METKFKINSINLSDSQWKALPFGRQLEYRKQIQEFKDSSKQGYISQKRTTNKKALKAFINLHGVTEYWCQYYDDTERRDDVFVIWYK